CSSRPELLPSSSAGSIAERFTVAAMSEPGASHNLCPMAGISDTSNGTTDRIAQRFERMDSESATVVEKSHSERTRICLVIRMLRLRQFGKIVVVGAERGHGLNEL